MINDLLRKFLSYLSLWYPNKEVPKKKDFLLRMEILKRLNKIKIEKKTKKNTYLIQ